MIQTHNFMYKLVSILEYKISLNGPRVLHRPPGVPEPCALDMENIFESENIFFISEFLKVILFL